MPNGDSGIALEYAGAPFHYLYPPLFNVLQDVTPVHSLGLAFHLVTGRLGYALVPVTLYILGYCNFSRSGFRRRFAAIFYSVFPSPAYVLRAVAKSGVTLRARAVGFRGDGGLRGGRPRYFALPLVLLAIAAAWRSRWLTATLLIAACHAYRAGQP